MEFHCPKIYLDNFSTWRFVLGLGMRTLDRSGGLITKGSWNVVSRRVVNTCCKSFWGNWGWSRKYKRIGFSSKLSQPFFFLEWVKFLKPFTLWNFLCDSSQTIWLWKTSWWFFLFMLFVFKEASREFPVREEHTDHSGWSFQVFSQKVQKMNSSGNLVWAKQSVHCHCGWSVWCTD